MRRERCELEGSYHNDVFEDGCNWYNLTTYAILCVFFFFSSRRRHTSFDCDWSSDVCSSDLGCDPAADDHLGDWHITATAMLERDRFVVETVRAAGAPPLVIVPGGGYGPSEIGRASCRERV